MFDFPCHCEERSDVVIRSSSVPLGTVNTSHGRGSTKGSPVRSMGVSEAQLRE